MALERLPAEYWQAAFVPLEAAINQLIRYDAVLLRQLALQQGRVIAYAAQGLPVVQVRLLDIGVAISVHNEVAADVTLSGRVFDFVELAAAQDKAHALMHSAIELHGDTELALFMAKCLQSLDIDWEALVSPVIGGLLAHQVGQRLRGLFRWGQESLRTNRVAVRDYLYDEKKCLAAPELQQDFADQVDELRFASDRLEARFQRLRQALNNKDSS